RSWCYTTVTTSTFQGTAGKRRSGGRPATVVARRPSLARTAASPTRAASRAAPRSTAKAKAATSLGPIATQRSSSSSAPKNRDTPFFSGAEGLPGIGLAQTPRHRLDGERLGTRLAELFPAE